MASMVSKPKRATSLDALIAPIPGTLALASHFSTPSEVRGMAFRAICAAKYGPRFPSAHRPVMVSSSPIWVPGGIAFPAATTRSPASSRRESIMYPSSVGP